MAIEFLTDLRSYDPHRHSISFWGHDGATEIAFRLDRTVLEPLLNGRPGPMDELSAMMIYDRNILRIRAFARKLYEGEGKTRFDISKGRI